MIEAIKRLEPILGLSVARMPALVVSILVAEAFFKLGSFSLECIAFLSLWRALDWAQQRLLKE